MSANTLKPGSYKHIFSFRGFWTIKMPTPKFTVHCSRWSWLGRYNFNSSQLVIFDDNYEQGQHMYRPTHAHVQTRSHTNTLTHAHVQTHTHTHVAQRHKLIVRQSVRCVGLLSTKPYEDSQVCFQLQKVLCVCVCVCVCDDWSFSSLFLSLLLSFSFSVEVSIYLWLSFSLSDFLSSSIYQSLC